MPKEQDEQRQDGDLRNAVEQQHDGEEAAPRERLQPDGKAKHKPDSDRDREGDRQLEQGELQCVGQLRGSMRLRRRTRVREQRAERGDDPRRRAEEQGIDEEARRDFPEASRAR